MTKNHWCSLQLAIGNRVLTKISSKGGLVTQHHKCTTITDWIGVKFSHLNDISLNEQTTGYRRSHAFQMCIHNVMILSLAETCLGLNQVYKCVCAFIDVTQLHGCHGVIK